MVYGYAVYLYYKDQAWLWDVVDIAFLSSEVGNAEINNNLLLHSIVAIWRKVICLDKIFKVPCTIDQL